MAVTDEDVQAALDGGEWVEKTDKKSGKTYFQNKKTKATCWDLKKELGKQAKGDGESPKKEKKEKKDKKEKKEKKKKKEDDGSASEESPKKKDKKDKKDKKEKQEEPAEDTKDSKDTKDKKDKTTKSEKSDKPPASNASTATRSKRGSMISNTSSRPIGDATGSVVTITPVIVRSDDPTRGNFMTHVTLELGNGMLEGPERVYGWTEREARLAASLRREQMRQQHYDRMPLREYLGAHDDATSSVVAADYFDGDASLPTHALGPFRASLSPHSTHRGGSPVQYKPYGMPPSNTSNLDEIDIASGREGALRAAAACGDIGAVMSLLRSGTARVDEPRQDGKTALHHAARHGHVEVIDVLLEAGASPLQRDAKGRSPLDLASQFGQRAAVARLQRQPARFSSSPVTPLGANPSPPRPLGPAIPYDAGLTRRPMGAPPVALSPLEARRQLSAEVTQAMSGVTSMVKGWIKEWAPAAEVATPMQRTPVRAGPQQSQRVSPPRPMPQTGQVGQNGIGYSQGMVSPASPASPSPEMIEQLTAHIWAAAGQVPQQQVPNHTPLSAPPSPHYPTPRNYAPRPHNSTNYAPNSTYLLPTDGIDV